MQVSIPPWFDFAWEALRQLRERELCFNPTLVRFCLRPLRSLGPGERGFNPTLVRFCLGEMGEDFG